MTGRAAGRDAAKSRDAGKTSRAGKVRREKRRRPGNSGKPRVLPARPFEVKWTGKLCDLSRHGGETGVKG